MTSGAIKYSIPDAGGRRAGKIGRMHERGCRHVPKRPERPLFSDHLRATPDHPVAAASDPAGVRLGRAGRVNGLAPSFLEAMEPSRRRVGVQRLRYKSKRRTPTRHEVDERLIW